VPQLIEAIAFRTAVVAHVDVETTEQVTSVSMIRFGAVETVATQQLHVTERVVLC